MNRTFRLIYNDGEISTYDHIEDYIKSVDSISENIIAGIQIQYKNIRTGSMSIESGLHIEEYNNDELNEQLNLFRAEQAEWAEHLRHESRGAVYV